MIRKKATIIAGDVTDVSSFGIVSGDVVRVWTLYDLDELLAYGTNTKETDWNDLTLKHLNGVFLEDKVHDWKFGWVDGKERFHYYSRVVKTGDTVDVLFELKE